MLVTIDVGDRFAELGQMSGSHTVLRLLHSSAQPEPDSVDDVASMRSMAPELSQYSVVLAMLQYDSCSCIEDAMQLVCRLLRCTSQ